MVPIDWTEKEGRFTFLVHPGNRYVMIVLHKCHHWTWFYGLISKPWVPTSPTVNDCHCYEVGKKFKYLRIR
jgi:hypothetical protein